MTRLFALSVTLTLAVACLALPAVATAGDGDVDYSAPYITVDPETGKLITVNPGPTMKVHPAPSENGNAGDATIMAGAQSTISGPSKTPAADAMAGSGYVIAAAITGAVILSSVLFLFLRKSGVRDA